MDVIFSRCPVGTVTEMLMRTGRIQEALKEEGHTFRLLQEMDPKFMPAHFTQVEPLAFRDGGNIPPIWAQSQENRSVVVGVTYQYERQGIFVRNDSDIKCLEDLKGRKFAIPVRTAIPVDFQKATALCGLECALEGTGVHMSDIRIVDIPCSAYNIKQSKSLNVMKKDFDLVTEEFAAVQEGLADAAYANSVKVTRLMEQELFRNLLDEDKQRARGVLNNNNPIVITCTKKFAYEHPDIVVLYLKELINAGNYAKDHKDEFIANVCEGIYEASPEEMINSYSDDINMIRVPSLNEEDVKALKKRADFLFRCGIINHIPDIDSWVDPNFLEKALKEI